MAAVIARRLLFCVCIAMTAASCTGSEPSTAVSPAEPSPVAAESSATTATPAPTTAAEDAAAPSTTDQDPPTSDPQPDDQPQCAHPLATNRVDVQASGNRISPDRVNLAAAEHRTIELTHTIDWILADPAVPGGWVAFAADGTSTAIGADGTTGAAPVATTLPPTIANDGNLQSPFALHDRFSDPLPDGRVVHHGSIAAVLSSPTDRYGHGVLGDAIEAAAIEWVDLCSDRTSRIEISDPDVIEGVAPLLSDVDNDGDVEILVTLSNAGSGARLVLYELDGTVRGESEPIGRGNRWRNQLAAGQFGPNAETEIVDVRTPHIGGTVQAFRLSNSNPSLERVAASAPDYTSHVLGLRNLDMGIAAHLNGDDQLDVVVARATRDRLVALTRSTDGWSAIADREVDGLITSNFAIQQSPNGGVLAVGAGATLNLFQE